MVKFNISDIFKTPSQEEVEQMMRDRYEANMSTPENFSLWYEDLRDAIEETETDFSSPNSAWFTLPFEVVEWINGGSYSNEKIEEFGELIIDEFSSHEWVNELDNFFMKTGVFSDKFNYSNSCELLDIKNAGKQALSLFYGAMMVGANTSNEIVVREYIGSDIEEKIYNGMPLRTEFRVFVDIDGDDSELIDVVNYWHPDTMSNGLYGHDLEIYLSAADRICGEFAENRHHVGSEVLEIVKNIRSDAKVLHGKWSIDVMMERGFFYIIDCARMNRSALVEHIGE